MNLFRHLPVLGVLLAVACGTADALMLAGGRGNTNAPPGDAGLINGWNNTGSVRGRYQSPRGDGPWHVSSSRAGVIHLYEEWFLTTYHAWWYDNPTGAVVGAVCYTVDQDSMVRLTNDTTVATNANVSADLAMFRVKEKPALPRLNLTTMQPGGLIAPVLSGGNKQVVMIASGHPRIDEMTYWGADWKSTNAAAAVYSGHAFWPDRSQCILRWGVNDIDLIPPARVTQHFNMPNPFGSAWVFRTTFNTNAGPHECQAALLDSGGAVFYNNKGHWELTGVILTMSHPDGSSPNDSSPKGIAYGGYTYAADLSFYRDQILRTLRPEGWPDLIIDDSGEPVKITAGRQEMVSVPITTVNQGEVAATHFYSSLYLVPSWNHSANLNLSEARIPVLEAGISVTNTHRFLAPSLPGTYLLIAVADNYDQSAESRENNNQSGWLQRTLEITTDFTYAVTTNNGSTNITITGYTGDRAEEVIPASINGIPVTRIEADAFLGCARLTDLTIPASITYIGSSAFKECSGLERLVMEGAPPAYDPDLFSADSRTIISYPPGTAAWPSEWAGRPTTCQVVMPAWSVYEGKLTQWSIDRPSNPVSAVVKKKNKNALLVIRKDRILGTLISWGSEGAASASFPVSLTTHPGLWRNDRNGRTVVARNLVSMSLSEHEEKASILFGTSTWSGRYSSKGVSESLSLYLTGRGIDRSDGKEGYGIETLRYNRKVSDALNKSVNTAHAEEMLRRYLAEKMKRNPSEIGINLPRP